MATGGKLRVNVLERGIDAARTSFQREAHHPWSALGEDVLKHYTESRARAVPVRNERCRRGRRLGMWAAALLGVTSAGFILRSAAGDVERPAAPPTTAGATLAPQPFALVELYTSEGCSSCPPADRLLSDLVTTARRDGVRIFPLAFHVDYWNRLGWTDPWSDPAYSDRQSLYAGAFESRYTPQMVVNGSDRFVGSDRERVRQSIESALATPAEVAVDARLVRTTTGPDLRVLWQVTPVPRGSHLHVALVERGLESRVARGENRGRTLRHDNVVRVFETVDVPAGGRGETHLIPPSDVSLGAASVIVYVQSEKNHRVLGAVQLEIRPPPPAVRAARSVE